MNCTLSRLHGSQVSEGGELTQHLFSCVPPNFQRISSFLIVLLQLFHLHCSHLLTPPAFCLLIFKTHLQLLLLLDCALALTFLKFLLTLSNFLVLGVLLPDLSSSAFLVC